MRNAAFDARPVKIGGIGGVATRIDCRGRGIASEVMREAVSSVANDIIVAFDVEHAAVGTRPDHILPRQSRDDLWRPDGFKEARSEPPTLVTVHYLDAIAHRFDQAHLR